MKVIIEIEHFDPMKGGAEAYTALLCDYLRKQGHHIEVLAMDWRNCPPEINFVKVPVRGITRWQRWISFVVNTKAIIKKRGADLVLALNRGGGMDLFQPHGGTVPGSQRQNILRQPNFLTAGIRASFFRFSPKAVVARMLDHMAYQTARRFIALSRMVVNDMMRYYKISEEKIALVHNGVDLQRFHPEAKKKYGLSVRRRLGIPDDILVFSLVAHNFSLKGVRELIIAASNMGEREKCCWLVAGRGRPGRFLKLAKKLCVESRIVFTGPVSRTEEIYAASDVYVHPTWYDPCSLVVLEALASGLPVITTKFNGAGELLQDGKSGFVIESPRETDALNNLMTKLTNRELREHMSAEARKLAETISWERHFNKIEKVITDTA